MWGGQTEFPWPIWQVSPTPVGRAGEWVGGGRVGQARSQGDIAEYPPSGQPNRGVARVMCARGHDTESALLPSPLPFNS